MALLKLLQIRCICRIYCLFNCPQVNQPEAKFSCSFQELNLSLLEFEVDVKREHGLCLPLALFEYNATNIFHYMKNGS